MTKKELRSFIRQQKKQLNQEVILSMSQKICACFLQLPAFKKADQFFGYIPFNQEVRIHPIIEAAWEAKKEVAVPRVENGQMNFYLITKWSDLEVGYYGILEPKGGIKVVPSKKTLMLLPGLAFDIHKNRLGYGAGFYDTYLENHEMPETKIALAYDFQLFNEIPATHKDIKVDRILTEKRDIE